MTKLTFSGHGISMEWYKCDKLSTPLLHLKSPLPTEHPTNQSSHQPLPLILPDPGDMGH